MSNSSADSQAGDEGERVSTTVDDVFEVRREAGRVVLTIRTPERTFEVDFHPDGALWLARRLAGTR